MRFPALQSSGGDKSYALRVTCAGSRLRAVMYAHELNHGIVAAVPDSVRSADSQQPVIGDIAGLTRDVNKP